MIMKKINPRIFYGIIFIIIICITGLFFIIRKQSFRTETNEEQSNPPAFLPSITIYEDNSQSEAQQFTVPALQFDSDGNLLIPETSALSGLDQEQKKIIVSNDDFYPWIIEIYENLDKYIGYEISITGAVFHDFETMVENEFVPARFTVTPGDAELIPVGLLCEYEKASELVLNTWVTVTGVIISETRQATDPHHHGLAESDDDHDHLESIEPKIIVNRIENTESVDGYVYP